MRVASRASSSFRHDFGRGPADLSLRDRTQREDCAAVEHKPLWKRLVLIAVLGGMAISAGCISNDPTTDDPTADDGSDDGLATTTEDLTSSCPAYASSVYT